MAEATKYGTTASDVLRRYAAVRAAVAAIDADLTADGPARAARVRAEVLVPLRALLGDAEAYRPATPAIQTVHDACLAFLRASVESFELFAAGFEQGDASTVAAAGAKRDEAGRHFETWSAGLTGLLAAGGQPTGTVGNP